MKEQHPTKASICERIDKSFDKPFTESILKLVKEGKRAFSIPQIALALNEDPNRINKAVSKLFKNDHLNATDLVYEAVPIKGRSGKRRYLKRKTRFYVHVAYPYKTVEVEYQAFDRSSNKIITAREVKRVKSYAESKIEGSNRTELILKYLEGKEDAQFASEIESGTRLSKNQIDYPIQILLQNGRIKRSEQQFPHLGYLYFVRESQYKSRINKPKTLYKGDNLRLIEEIEHSSKVKKRLISKTKIIKNYSGPLGSRFYRFLKRDLKAINFIKCVKVIDQEYFYHADFLSGDELKKELDRVGGKYDPKEDLCEDNRLLKIRSKRSEKTFSFDITSEKDFGEELWEANQNNPVSSEAWFLNLRYMIYLGISQNRRKGKEPSSIKRLFDHLRESSVADKLSKYDSKRRVNTSRSLALFYFYKGIFNLKNPELIEFLHHEKVWQRTLGLNRVPSDGQASNFKRFVGRENFEAVLETYASQIKTLLGVDELKENIIFRYIKEYSYGRYTKRRESRRYSGWDLFMDFLYSFGIVSQIMNGLRKEKRYNAKYPLETMATTYICKAPLDVKNNYKMGFKLKQNGHLDDYYNKDTPHAKTLARNYEYLDISKMEKLSQSIAKRSRRFSRSKGRIGIDGTKVRVFGRGYKNNGDGNGVGLKLFDKKFGREILCIYLVFVYDIDTREPICFRLVDSKEDATKKELLLEMIEDAVAIIGKECLELILFDREYYKFSIFNELTERGYPFITPAEDAGMPKKIKESILDSDFVPLSEKNKKEGIADRKLALDNYKGMIRQVILRKEFVEDGELKVVRHDFLTNIGDVSAKEILEWYGKRWNLENFYKELKNEWYLKYFPSPTPHAIKCYIFFILITYSLVNIFKRMIGKGRHQLETVRDVVFIQWVDISLQNGEYRFSFYLARDGIDPYEFTKKRMEMMADAI